MTDYVNEYLRKHKKFTVVRLPNSYREYRDLAPQMKLADGTILSVQVSENHYCTPRDNDAYKYHNVEVGYPSRKIPEIMKWCEDKKNPTETVYGYVPVEVLNAVIEAAGGIVEVE